MNRIYLKNLQRKVSIHTRRYRELLLATLRLLDLDQRALTVIYCTDRRIRYLNDVYRSMDAPTDVLSFPDDEAEEEGRRYLGEVFIAPSVAAENAKAYGVSFERELTVLHVHGLLHLLGFDHETDQGQMEALQNDLLARLAAAGITAADSTGKLTEN